MQNLVKTNIKAISDAEALIARDINDVPHATRPGFEIQKQTAKDSIVTLRKTIEENTIPGRLAGIFAEGDEKTIEATADFLQENRGLVVDAAEFYRKVAKDVEANMGEDRIFRVTQYSTLIAHIREVGNAFKLGEIDAPKFKEDKPLPDLESITNYIRDLVQESSGDTLNVLLLRRQLLSAVIDQSLTAKNVPVLVTNSVPSERAALTSLFYKSGKVEFDEEFEPSNKTITAAFRNAK